MKKYILKSKAFSGAVTFGYDAAGYLVFFINEAEMTEDQLKWCSHNLPAKEEYLESYKGIIKGTIEEIPMDISFDAFWDAYGHKVNRKRCEPLWKKLSDADKATAIMNIKPYEAFIKRHNRPKRDPENYLSPKFDFYKNQFNSL